MYDNEMLEKESHPSPLGINQTMRSYFAEMAKWGKLMAIVGFIVLAFIILGGIALLLGSSMLGSQSVELSQLAGFPLKLFGALYLLIGVFYFFPTYYLLKFSDLMRASLRSNDESLMTSSFENLKSLFKFMGIITVVIIAIYLLMFIAIAVGSMFGSAF